jgi:hypothetical protein
MKMYLISDEQIMSLYASGTAGSRNFERVIEEVIRREIKLRGDGTYTIQRYEEKAKDHRGDPGNQPDPPEAAS